MDFIDLEKISELSEDDLNRLQLLTREELKSRALESFSKKAEISDTHNSKLKDFPQNTFILLEEESLWCLGVKTQSSKLSHQCKFVSIDGVWCWESEFKLSDLMEYTHEPKPTVKTLTQVMLVEGTEIDIVSCTASGTSHKVKKIDSYIIKDGAVVPSLERKIKFNNHR